MAGDAGQREAAGLQRPEGGSYDPASEAARLGVSGSFEAGDGDGEGLQLTARARAEFAAAEDELENQRIVRALRESFAVGALRGEVGNVHTEGITVRTLDESMR